MRVLVTSEKDIASQAIRSVLIEEHGFMETGDTFEGNSILSLDGSILLITSTRDMIHCDHLESHFDAEAFIFCSRHRAESGKPALLVHSTGNLGQQALFGGNPHQLSVSTASLVSVALKRLHKEQANRQLDAFDVTMEVTHHGPTTMNTPLLFIELGSDEAYWRHEDGARAVAAAALDCASAPFAETAVIGFGGTHYASKFNKLILERDLQVGHVAPKYAILGLTRDVVLQMMNRSHEIVKTAIIDWKGTNAEQKGHLLPMLESLGLAVVRAKRA
ncbi:MAG: D-aminoacyl-tRNA deacylase [Candidatus Thorarchaeota archaeon]